jgi:hypothetical protein
MQSATPTKSGQTSAGVDTPVHEAKPDRHAGIDLYRQIESATGEPLAQKIVS